MRGRLSDVSIAARDRDHMARQAAMVMAETAALELKPIPPRPAAIPTQHVTAPSKVSTVVKNISSTYFWGTARDLIKRSSTRGRHMPNVSGTVSRRQRAKREEHKKEQGRSTSTA